jgi:predicted helicase
MRNTKWLQDDYVKFIRFAQWKIEQTGKGVLGFITNHAYLDSPIFRGMRQSLLKTFEEIYVLNLHGNSYRKERSPDGSKDENIFDIQQGVAIALYVKKSVENKATHLHYADLWGLRQYKYDCLNENNIKTTVWKSLRPHTKEYLFVPRDETLLKRYEGYPQITDIFQLGSIAVQTHRDNFVVDFNRNDLKERIRVFRDTAKSDQTVCETLGLKETGSWKIYEKRRKVMADNNWESKIVEFCFHPFDVRWIFYHGEVVDRDRWTVMQHMLISNNIGLNCMKEYAYEVTSYNYALISGAITNDRIFVSNKGAAYFFPLYVFRSVSKEPR